MARDGLGTYTATAGQPVTAGTVVSPTTHNTLVADLTAEMTDSLSRSGKGGMTAPLRTADGSLSAPALSFTSDTDTGFFRSAANTIQAVANGAAVMTFAAAQLASLVAHAFSEAVTFAKGLVVTQSTANTVGVTATGNGTAAGVAGTGGASNAIGVLGTGTGTGAGVKGVAAGTGIGVDGTASNGIAAVRGTSTGTAAGGYLANTSTGNGVYAIAEGAGAAVKAENIAGTGPAVRAEGNATRGTINIVPQSAEPSAPLNGDIYYDSDTHKLRVYAGGAWVDLH